LLGDTRYCVLAPQRKKTMKQELLVRFANESYYTKTVAIDVTKLTEVTKFPDEVFATIDGLRIAIRREEYETAMQNLETN
jgi:hypothetical protein